MRSEEVRMTTEELKPCPFCGSNRLDFAKIDGRGMFVYCTNCKASTNIAVRREDAVYLWNRRAGKEAMMNDAGDWLAQFSKERNMGMQGSKSGWISVEDRLPETDEVMAIRCVTKKGVVSWNRAWYDGQFWHGSGSFAGVTHWMPISTEVGK